MQTKGRSINVKSIVYGAAAGAIATMLMLIIVAVLLSNGKIDGERLMPVMVIINALSGLICGIRTKKTGRGEGSLNAIISGIVYSALCIICAIALGNNDTDAAVFIRISAISVILSWAAYKINLFKSNKKFRNGRKRQK